MIPRTLKAKLLELAAYYPVVAMTGPRQSGKTTLCRATFPDHHYISLEAMDSREFARDDPRGFLLEYGGDTGQQRSHGRLVPWRHVGEVGASNPP